MESRLTGQADEDPDDYRGVYGSANHLCGDGGKPVVGLTERLKWLVVPRWANNAFFLKENDVWHTIGRAGCDRLVGSRVCLPCS